MVIRYRSAFMYYGLVAAAFAVPHFAHAADAGTREVATASSAGLEEVVVTARRREENVQQVPVSITALGTQALEDRGITGSMGLTGQVPNLSVRQGIISNASDIRLRGVPGVSVYVDGIANSSSAGQLMQVVDIERIEVLRGPQGTLFGKNAIGGAIQYITVEPGNIFTSNAKLTFGSYNRVDAAGSLNIPLTDTLSTKITGAVLSAGGYVHNIPDDQMFGSKQSTVARIDTMWKPSDAFSARVVLAYSGEHENQPPMVSTQNKRVCAGDPRPRGYTGAASGPLCILHTIGLPVDETLDFGAQEQWKAYAVEGGPSGYDYKSYNSTADISYELSDLFSLRSLTGYREFNYSKLADHDATPYVLIHASTRERGEELTQELQLAFDGEWLTGTTGLYYYNNSGIIGSTSWTYTDLRAGTLAAQSLALGGRTPAINNRNTEYYIKGKAAFSEWTAKFRDLSLTLGGRYTSEDNTTIYNTPPTVSLDCCTRVPTLTPGGPRLVAPYSDTFTNFTPRASIQYQWTPDVMTYFTYSKGFNAGGFNTTFQAALAFLPETLTNYEVGFKSDLFDQRLRLNAAAFRGDWDKIQVSILAPIGQTVILARQNAGKGVVEGIEAQATVAASDDLVLNAAVGYLETKYTDLGNAPGLTLNTPFPYSPKLTYTIGSQYQMWLNNDSVTFRADYTWVGKTETNIDPRFTVPQKGYGLLNARATYRPDDANWSVAVYGTNLTNQFYTNQALNITQEGWGFAQAGRPRELGVTFTAQY
jgi:iron complex outermembrane receptor protein